jgi:hypothetical protein
MLVSDGSSARPVLAPFQPNTANYAVEAEVRIDNTNGCGSFNFFALDVRVTDSAFYGAGDDWNCGPVAIIDTFDASDVHNYTVLTQVDSPPDPGHGWHTYRLTAKDNQLTFSFDGSMVARATDNHILDAGRVGLQAAGPQISVRSFKVIAL